MNQRQRYPCGCEDEVKNGVHIFKPCSENCEIYKFVLEETKRQGHQLEIMRSISTERM